MSQAKYKSPRERLDEALAIAERLADEGKDKEACVVVDGVLKALLPGGSFARAHERQEAGSTST